MAIYTYISFYRHVVIYSDSDKYHIFLKRTEFQYHILNGAGESLHLKISHSHHVDILNYAELNCITVGLCSENMNSIPHFVTLFKLNTHTHTEEL